MKFIIRKENLGTGYAGSKFIVNGSELLDNPTSVVVDKLVENAYKYEFVQSEPTVDKLTEIIEIEFKEPTTDFSDLTLQEQEEDFNEIVDTLDGETGSFYNTQFNTPIDLNEIDNLNVINNNPVFKIKTKINYFDSQIYDAQLNTTIVGTNFYRNSKESNSNTREDIISDILVEAGGTSQFRTIIGEKLKINGINSKKKLYPSYSEISITNNNVNILNDVLSNLNIYDSFMAQTVDKMYANLVSPTPESTGAQAGGFFRGNFLNFLIANISNSTPTDVDLISGDDSYPRINYLDKLEAIGQLQSNSLANSNLKTMLNFKQVPNEIIFYKIEKFIGPQNRTPVNVFYIPANSNTSVFIDTEVLYNGEYTYKVSAYVVAYGINYNFQLISRDFETRKAKFRTDTTPEPIMFETELFSRTVRVSSDAPLAPSINFINESTSESSFKIAMAMRHGYIEKDHFIKILPQDEFTLAAAPSGKMHFSYNKEPLRVQILRLEEKPRSILDFSQATVLTATDFSIETNPEVVIYKERVVANKKYYYIFRTLSESGMVSNPSPVYEVELLKMADKSKLSIEIIEVDLDRKLVSNKLFRKLLQVRPSLRHVTINKKFIEDDFSPDEVFALNNAGENTLDKYQLGDAEYPIWGRKFKIRVKSNDSGKIIDINVNFDLIVDKKREDL